MIRREVVAADPMYTALRIFVRADADSPFYQIGWDLDTEWVSYFESPTATHGTMVLAPFDSWTIDALRSRLAEHAAGQPWATTMEATDLIDAVVDSTRGRR
jgi:hypothetical protein